MFRWLGQDDNRFERREEGSAMPRAALDAEIEQWLQAVIAQALPSATLH